MQAVVLPSGEGPRAWSPRVVRWAVATSSRWAAEAGWNPWTRPGLFLIGALRSCKGSSKYIQRMRQVTTILMFCQGLRAAPAFITLHVHHVHHVQLDELDERDERFLHI